MRFLRQTFQRLLGVPLDKARANATLAAYREALTGDAGDLVLDDLAIRFKLFEPTRNTDTNDLARREGAREIWVFLAKMQDKAINPSLDLERKLSNE